jgi:short-subunit dehydrogenase
MDTTSRSTAAPVAIVTGASGGIGHACAELLATRGFRVFGTSRNPGSAGRMRDFELLALDVRDDTSVVECVRQILLAAGRIDVLVNNAGVAMQGAVEETSIDEIKGVFETNLFGAIRMARAVLPTMRAQGKGRIVNLGSVAGFVPMPYQAAYCASKHALHGFSHCLDHELRRFGIRVSVVEPGFVQTEISAHTPLPVSQIGEYVSARTKASVAIAQAVNHGIEAAVIARDVVQAATAARPTLRYLSGREAKTLALISCLLPPSWFDRGLRKRLALD